VKISPLLIIIIMIIMMIFDNNNDNNDDFCNGNRKRLREEEDEEEVGKGFRPSGAVGGRDTVFRIVVVSNKIGKVIEKQGSKINQVREDMGARMKIAGPVTVSS
jgi:hypothetical protein